MWSNAYGKSYIVYLIGSLMGSLLIALLCKWLITKNVILEFLGQNTIVILATHEPVKRIVLKIIEIAGEKVGIALSIYTLQRNILSSISVIVVVMLIEVLVIYILRIIKNGFPKAVQKNFLTFIR